MSGSDLLTVGELKEYIKDIPDNVRCIISKIQYDEDIEELVELSSSPIHTVGHDEYNDNDSIGGLLNFQTHYTREGILGMNDGCYGLDKYME